MENVDQGIKNESEDVSGAATEKQPVMQPETKPKWPWVVAVMLLVVLFGIVMILVLKPWKNEDETAQIEDNLDNRYRGDVLSVEEGMRELCRDPRLQDAKAPIIVEGWLPRYWSEQAGIYTGAQSDREYFVVCDWKVGIAMEDGLQIMERSDADKIYFTAITLDTDYYRENEFSGNWDAPAFFSDMINDKEKDGSEVAMGVLMRESEQEYQNEIDECDGDESCLAMLDMYHTAFMERDGYRFIVSWSQAAITTCQVSDSPADCRKIFEWEDESRSRLAKWLKSDNWVKF